MTDHDDPVDRLRAFLDVWLVPGRDTIERIHADRAYELRGSDIAAALQQLDDARTEVQRLTNPTPEQVREMQAQMDREEAAYWEAAARSELRSRTGRVKPERPLTPGVPGYACARCGSLFTSPGELRDEHSRLADSPWCRGCVDQCHEGGDGHRCVICTPESEGAPR